MDGMSDRANEVDLLSADLWEAERQLWEAFGRGEVVDLRTGDQDADDPMHADIWDESRKVRAQFLAALLLGAAEPVAGHVSGVRLAGALIEGPVELSQGEVNVPVELTACVLKDGLLLPEARTRTINLSGSAFGIIDATSAQIAGNLILSRCHAEQINIASSHVTGRLNLEEAHLMNASSIALLAEGMTAEGGMFCEGLNAKGQINLDGAHIGRQLVLSGACVTNSSGIAVSGYELSVDGSMFCEDGFKAEGQVRLNGAHISGQLGFNGARLINPGSVAFGGDGITVDLGMFCQARLKVKGQFRINGACISRQLTMTGAHFSNPDGIAIRADGLNVTGDMFCQEGFKAEGQVRLTNAKITGQLGFRNATLRNLDDIALLCSDLRADTLWLDNLNVVGTVDLMQVQVRVLIDNPSEWPDHSHLEGLVYDDLQPYCRARGTDGRLAWLSRAEPEYRPQPYEQLAAYYRRLGHEEEARQVLIAKEAARRAVLSIPGKILSVILAVTVGYGYRPLRAFVWLVTLVIAGSVYFTIYRPAPLNASQHAYFQPVLYSADLVIPIVNLGQSGSWSPAGFGQWVAAALVASGWVLATAVVAGLTRVLTRI